MAAQTATGDNPFAGAPGQSSASPTPTTPDPAATAGMPTFTVTGTKNKTFGGIPTNQFQDQLRMDTGARTPGLSPEDQGFTQGPNYTPIYKDGDQWAPAADPDPDTVRNIQIGLINAGLLTTKNTHLGLWDSTSATAYAKVLAQANLQGISATAALSDYVASAAQLPQNQLSGSDLEAVGNSAAQTILGRDLNATELTQFTAAFQQAFATDQPQTSAGVSQLGQDLLTKEHGTEATTTSLQNVSQRALSILTGGQ